MIDASDDRRAIGSQIEQWAYNHPRPTDVGLYLGSTRFAPLDILREIRRDSTIGNLFLNFIKDSSDRSNQSPLEIVHSAEQNSMNLPSQSFRLARMMWWELKSVPGEVRHFVSTALRRSD